MPITIRRARPDDAEAIRALVLGQPRMNPTGLDWANFHVATRAGGVGAIAGAVVGTVQLRPSAPGVAELSSLVVAVPERGQGLAGRLIAAALQSAPGRVMVVTAAVNVRHYARWGFRPVPALGTPAAIRVNFMIGQAASVIRLVQGCRPRRMVVLDLDLAAPGPGLETAPPAPAFASE